MATKNNNSNKNNFACEDEYCNCHHSEHEHHENCDCEHEHHDTHCDCGHKHSHKENGKKQCILYDDREFCINCGECEMCDLDPTKKCNNCGKCLEEYALETDEKGFYNFEAVFDKESMSLEDIYKAYGLNDSDEDE